MKASLWKLFFCFLPVIIAGWAIWDASPTGPQHFFHFKKGVDLSGGTILVYEMDTVKLQKKYEEAKEEGKAGADSKAASYYQVKSSELAASLKQRIDPTSTFNIIIRPSGTEGRVEIIIPTGDPAKAGRAEKAWQDLLGELKTAFGLKQTLTVPRGRIEELVDQIQQQSAMDLWENKLLNSKEAWTRLVDKLKGLKLLNRDIEDPKAGQKDMTYIQLIEKIKPGHIQGPGGLVEVLQEGLMEPSKQKVEGDIRGYAWEELIVELCQWDALKKALADNITEEDSAKKAALVDKQLKWLEEDLKTVPPDGYSELVGRVYSAGNVVSQAGIESLRPLLGDMPGVGLLSRQEIEDFITQRYGPSAQVIEAKINEKLPKEVMALIRDPSLEDVQRVKDLVSKVGALEFKMLANQKDDKLAIKEISELFKGAGIEKKLEEAAVSGQPPPVVMEGNEPKKYLVELAKGAKSTLTYGWVELGKQERAALGFNNESRTATGRDNWKHESWIQMEAAKNTAIKVIDKRRIAGSSGEKFLWEGALFYRRECKDRNLPDKERRAKKWEYFVLARNPEFDPVTGEQTTPITGDLLSQASADIREGRPSVSFHFKAAGGTLFGKLTGKNVPDEAGGSEESQFKRHLAIILDGLVMSAPTINSKITTSGSITGDFTRREVDNLVNILRAGALPASLKPQPVSETTIGPLLGQDTIDDGVRAVVLAFVAVLVFMCIYYRFAGLVASIALFANLILTVGFMVMVQATFTLPGLAGLVLMLGMAVDANVLIYERLREERDRGASLTLALRNGYERALPTIIDTHLTSIFTAIVLYAVGTDQLRGFAISLAVGLIISLFTSLYMTHVIFNYWQARGWLRKLGMFRLLSKPNINFMGIRNYVFVATSIVTIAGLILFLYRAPLDIDFTGGTAFTGKLKITEKKNIEELRSLVDKKHQDLLLQVASVKQVDKAGREFEIVYRNPDGKDAKPFTVTFVNEPNFKGRTSDTPAGREEIVKLLAGYSKDSGGNTVGQGLPDASVEQIFYSEDLANQTENRDKSRFFTVRTSEKERGLVEVVLIRLFQKDDKDAHGGWEPILEANTITKIDTSKLKDKGTAILEFEKPATTSFVHTVLQRQLQMELGSKDTPGQVAVRFETTGTGESKENGFKKMVVTFSPPLKPEQVAPVEEALNKAKAVLAIQPQPERLENFDSELAADTRMRALVAIFVSWVAIVLYLWFRFGSWTFGMAAVFCLIHDLCFTLGLVAIAAYLQPTFIGQALLIQDFKIDLNGVAALLTLVGYSVADTIVVFDRIREVRGKNPELTPKIINDSINQTLSRTLLTSGVTFLVVVVLYALGGPGVHLFAYVMTIGVIIGTLSSIYVASPLLLILGEGQHAEVRQRRPQVAEAPA